MRIKKFTLYATALIVTCSLPACKKADMAPSQIKVDEKAANFSSNTKFVMPGEDEIHEGTWLQWPHQFTYGFQYRNRLEPTWIDMVKALVESENVHIIAYNDEEKNRIIGKLQDAGISLAKVDFKIHETDDCWVRDNGPIFVKNKNGNLLIEDWNFNGWGRKTPFEKDNLIPGLIGNDIGTQVIDLNNQMELEGGAVAIDGNGTFMGTRSSILNANRNPGLTQTQAENLMQQKLGITNFIWLDGYIIPDDITDGHIDGFAAFVNSNIIVTMSRKDLFYWYVKTADINRIYAAKSKINNPYTIVTLPLTKKNVITAYGKNLGYKGSYCNFYIANTKVMVPTYNDPNDVVAIRKLQQIFPGKTVVGIDCRNLYEQGGMVHCVTQQQPAE